MNGRKNSAVSLENDRFFYLLSKNSGKIKRKFCRFPEKTDFFAVVFYGSLLGPLKKYVFIFIFPLEIRKSKKKKKKKKKLAQDPRSEFFFCVLQSY